MIKKGEQRILALIPARAGSKRLKNKNILDFNGLPLISWTINSALKSKYISKVIVSSDDQRVHRLIENFPSVFGINRPTSLATDLASSSDVALHALKIFPDYDYLILLQPTSPLRNTHDIDSAFEYLIERKARSCFSLCSAVTGDKNLCIINDSGYFQKHAENFLPESNIHSINGAIYINDIHDFLESKKFITESSIGYIMQRVKSIDIDSIDDFRAAEKVKTNI
jgi:CMP-N,N'-diacetyllegionaminic acid synthase